MEILENCISDYPDIVAGVKCVMYLATNPTNVLLPTSQRSVCKCHKCEVSTFESAKVACIHGQQGL